MRHTTRFEYDLAGNMIAKTDREGKVTSYAYDALNRLVKETDPLGQETTYTYDNRDNLISLTDPEGRITRFEYDRNNRTAKEIRPMGQATAYAYDANGNLTGKTDPQNAWTQYLYDDAQRLRTLNLYGPSNHGSPVKTTGFTYDKTGRMTAYNDGRTSASYAYDDAGQKLSETVNYGPFSKTHAYTYYKNGKEKTFTGPDNVAYTYAYDGQNLSSVEIPQNGFITWSGHTWNTPKTVTYPGGATRTNTYDKLMRLTDIQVKDPANATVMAAHYTFNRESNITARQTEHGAYDYGYDDLYRLTSVERPAAAAEGFTYDNSGNRLTSATLPGDWTYNANNEIQATPAASFTHNTAGNMTRKVASGITTVYNYDIENRLSTVEDGSGSLKSSYGYDPFGRRLWKEVDGIKTYFHYSDEGLVAELNQTGDVTKTYGYKPGGLWGTDPLFMKTGSEYAYYQNDHLGTPQKMLTSSGAVVWSARYDSFGKAAVEVETVTNNLRFPGQYYDVETGLHYNWNRYYDPGTGRYVTEDPIGLEGGINLYAYCMGDPVNLIDPEGLSFVGKIVSLGVKGGMKVLKKVRFDDAVKAVKSGEDVLSANRKVAKEIAEAVGDGKRPIHDFAHGPKHDGFRNHYHVHGRPKGTGHIFYTVAGALTVSFYAEDANAAVRAGAFVIDLFNPLSIGQDILDIYDAVSDFVSPCD